MATFFGSVTEHDFPDGKLAQQNGGRGEGSNTPLPPAPTAVSRRPLNEFVGVHDGVEVAQNAENLLVEDLGLPTFLQLVQEKADVGDNDDAEVRFVVRPKPIVAVSSGGAERVEKGEDDRPFVLPLFGAHTNRTEGVFNALYLFRHYRFKVAERRIQNQRQMGSKSDSRDGSLGHQVYVLKHA